MNRTHICPHVPHNFSIFYTCFYTRHMLSITVCLLTTHVVIAAELPNFNVSFLDHLATESLHPENLSPLPDLDIFDFPHTITTETTLEAMLTDPLLDSLCHSLQANSSESD